MTITLFIAQLLSNGQGPLRRCHQVVGRQVQEYVGILRTVVLQARQVKIATETLRDVGMYRGPFFLAGRKSVEVQDATYCLPY
jgi:hypothetical protein